MKIGDITKKFTTLRFKIKLICIVSIVLAILICCFSVRIWQKKAVFNVNRNAYKNVEINIKKTTEFYNLNFSDDSSDNSQSSKFKDNLKIVINDADYYEECEDYTVYSFLDNGEEYIQYYDEAKGDKTNKKAWTKSKAEDYGFKRSFDFNSLKNIKIKQFEKQGKKYVPLNGYRDEIALKVLNADKNVSENYDIEDVYFKLRGSKISEIYISYVLDGSQNVEKTYSFSYKNQKIEVPKI